MNVPRGNLIWSAGLFQHGGQERFGFAVDSWRGAFARTGDIQHRRLERLQPIGNELRVRGR